MLDPRPCVHLRARVHAWCVREVGVRRGCGTREVYVGPDQTCRVYDPALSRQVRTTC